MGLNVVVVAKKEAARQALDALMDPAWWDASNEWTVSELAIYMSRSVETQIWDQTVEAEVGCFYIKYHTRRPMA